MAARFEGKVALVTGGSRGIGRATVLRLASEGASVAFTYLTQEGQAGDVVSQAHGYGRPVDAYQCDVSDPEQVRKVVGSICKQHGKIDLLVNNAGLHMHRDTAKTTPDELRRILAVNVEGPFYVVQEVASGMKQRRYGRIVNVSSVAALVGSRSSAAYAASKAAILGLTKTWATEFAPDVKVNAVAMGYTDTDLLREIPEEQLAAVKREMPTGRFNRPEEVAALIADILSYENMTGQTLVLDGGRVRH